MPDAEDVEVIVRTRATSVTAEDANRTAQVVVTVSLHATPQLIDAAAEAAKAEVASRRQ